MISRRSSCGVAALDGYLYCIGGKIQNLENYVHNLLIYFWHCGQQYSHVIIFNLDSPFLIYFVHNRIRWNDVPVKRRKIQFENLLMGTDCPNAFTQVMGFLCLPTRISMLTLRIHAILIFRSTHEVVESNGFLFALGGNDGSSSLNSVERYDPKTNKWTIVTSMLTRRSSIGASVLECFNLEKKVIQTSIWPVPRCSGSDGSTTESTTSSSASSGNSNNWQVNESFLDRLSFTITLRGKLRYFEEINARSDDYKT